MAVQKLSTTQNILFLVSSILIVLILAISSLNTNSLFTTKNTSIPKQEGVLGKSTSSQEKKFWIEFLSDNPYYYPGWKRLNEIGHQNIDYVLIQQTNEALTHLKPQL